VEAALAACGFDWAAEAFDTAGGPPDAAALSDAFAQLASTLLSRLPESERLGDETPALGGTQTQGGGRRGRAASQNSRGAAQNSQRPPGGIGGDAASMETETSRDTASQVRPQFGLYNFLFHCKAFVHKSIIYILPPTICIAHTGAVLLHDFCATYDLTRPPFRMPYTIQYWS